MMKLTKLDSEVRPIFYRNDLNFLRGLAVLAVLVYHFEKIYLPGGWLGVDLFFFISGYLIYNKLFLGLNKDKSYIFEFYKKRFLRLTPSLLTVSLSSTIFYYFFLSPSDYFIHLKSTFYSLIYISNFFFLDFDFYSSPSNKYLTMLHTWSLGIEEQFYLLLPIIMILLLSYKKNIIFYIFSFFLISVILTNYFSDEHIFYNPITRFWEFLSGAIFMQFEPLIKKKIAIKKPQLGFIIILFSLMFFPDTTITDTLPKIVLFFGVILFLTVQNYDNFLVNNYFFQFSGKISYSLYLFHQPFFALLFIQNDKIQALNYIETLVIFLALFLFSYLNWKFVENKINQNKYFKILIIFFIIVICIFSLTIFDFPDDIEFFNLANKLFLLKVKEDGIVSQNGISCNNRKVEETCIFNRSSENKDIYILSDSSLRTLSASMLSNEKFDNYNIIHFTGNDCLFIFGKNISKNSCPNKEISKKDKFGNSIKDSIIIYGGRYPRYFTGKGFFNGVVQEDNDILVEINLKKEIESTLEIFQKNNNIVVLVYPIPEQGWNIPELFYYKNLPQDATVSYPYEIWLNRENESKNYLDSIELKNIIRIYPTEIFCDTLVRNECLGAFNGILYYADDDHLSLEGSNLLAELIASAIKDK